MHLAPGSARVPLSRRCPPPSGELYSFPVLRPRWRSTGSDKAMGAGPRRATRTGKVARPGHHPVRGRHSSTDNSYGSRSRIALAGRPRMRVESRQARARPTAWSGRSAPSPKRVHACPLPRPLSRTRVSRPIATASAHRQISTPPHQPVATRGRRLCPTGRPLLAAPATRAARPAAPVRSGADHDKAQADRGSTWACHGVRGLRGLHGLHGLRDTKRARPGAWKRFRARGASGE